ncbi:MAG: NAD(P)/FAD-dependent oxidoreductase [Candidatus Marinimicrobia bacterium]|nr:NAD(P)/FAD-dependent oxidoreductase [Candidatus Neomarinimicrobiota bacterium]
MLNLKNEFIFAPIKLGYTKNGEINDKHLTFYEKRSKFLGAVTPEPLYIDKGLREIPTQLGIDTDDKIAGLKKLTELLHSDNTKAIAHLNHPGRMANPKIPGNYFISSTDRACEAGGATPKKLENSEMNDVIKLFVDAALRAEKANFDIIELQFGHGYLMAQFLSPQVNDRSDEYGGSFENRIKFPLETLEAVKEAVKIPVIARISGDEMIEKGIKLPEMIKFSEILKENGISAIHISAGTVCSTPPWYFQHMFVPKGKTWEFAKAIKEKVDIPIIAVGQINETKDIQKIKKNNMADYLAVGRALVTDPEFVGKYLGEITGNIVPCLACAEGCLGGIKAGKGLQCLVNPEVGKETDVLPVKTKKPQKIAVVGAGLAGMEAALMLAKQGHQVDLYEKENLGGQFIYAPLTPHKKSMEKLIRYFENELETSNVNVIFKEIKKLEDILKYDSAVLATGSQPAVPKIEGLDKFYWAEILLEENLPENKNVLIIGGGLIGVDIATALIPKNNKVTIVKRTTDFGENMEMISKKLSLAIMKKNQTVFSDHTNIKKIDGATVYAEKNGEQITFENIDLIVVSTGMKSYNPLEEKLKGKIPIYKIGDAKKTGDAQSAINEGYELAMSIN